MILNRSAEKCQKVSKENYYKNGFQKERKKEKN